MAEKSDSDKLFSSSKGESEGTNHNKGSLVLGRLKSTKEVVTSEMSGPPPRSFTMCAIKNFWLCPHSTNMLTVAPNSNDTTLEADSYADTTCLGAGGPEVI